jgi:NitT/TauT family transport system ATP-binding protein
VRAAEADSEAKAVTARPSVVTAGVTHTYSAAKGSPVLALDGASVTIDGGQFASLIGPSGCGKSTLLNIIGGLLRPSAGSALIDGEPVAGPDERTGYMFQDATLLPWRTALDNIVVPVLIRHGRGAKAAEPHARELMASAGIAEFQDAYPHQLSGGMAQRVAICRMLVTNPTLLLLDEPFGALDELTRDSMNQVLYDVCRLWGSTSVMVTHSIAEAAFLSDVVYVMSARPGRIAAVVEVDLPHPRSLDSTTAHPRFGALVHRIRRALNEGHTDGRPAR